MVKFGLDENSGRVITWLLPEEPRLLVPEDVRERVLALYEEGVAIYIKAKPEITVRLWFGSTDVTATGATYLEALDKAERDWRILMKAPLDLPLMTDARSQWLKKLSKGKSVVVVNRHTHRYNLTIVTECSPDIVTGNGVTLSAATGISQCQDFYLCVTGT